MSNKEKEVYVSWHSSSTCAESGSASMGFPFTVVSMTVNMILSELSDNYQWLEKYIQDVSTFKWFSENGH